MDPLERLYEEADPPAYGLPERLRQLYGGDLGFSSPRLYANFVSSLDGVVALDPKTPPSVISQRSEADRFLMGLLRACADAVLIGASTFRAEPEHRWLPGSVYPPGDESFARLRRQLGKGVAPQLVIVTATGDLPISAPVFQAARGAPLVFTTREGAGRLKGRLPAACTVIPLSGEGPIESQVMLEALASFGHEVILTEGGPTLLGWLLTTNRVDELFLTLSPLVAGRGGREGRLGLVEGVAFEAAELRGASLLSLRKHGSHLFLRYALATARSYIRS